MIRVLIISAAGLAGIASIAAAGDDPPKMTVAQCQDIGAGLAELNGYSVVIKQGDSSVEVKQQYRLRRSRMTVSQNMIALKTVADSSNDVRNRLIDQISHGTGVIKPDTPEAVEYNRQFKTDVLDRPCIVTFGRISMKDLNPGDYDEKDKNPIPPLALAQLEPIIDHDEK